MVGAMGASTRPWASPASEAWALMFELIHLSKRRFMAIASEFDLSPPQVMELQRLLIKQGYEGVGEVDGKVGTGTRSATKKAQMKFNLPADSYPTVELIERLRTGNTSGSNR